MLSDIVKILPQILVLLTAVAALSGEMLRRPRLAFWATVVGLLVATGWGLSQAGLETTVFSGTYRVGTLSHWAVFILCPAAALCALLARAELRGTPREGTVYALLVFGTLGALLLAGAGDLMFIVLGVLMSGLAGFALAAHTKSDPATEGALKYFVYGSVTGAVMVFGLGYWVGLAGHTTLDAVGAAELHPLPYAFGLLALLAGVGYAASLFPFHFWTPDTFEGAPVSVAAFLSVAPKIGAVFALAQVVHSLPVDHGATGLILALLAAASMTFGNVVALVQHNLLRLLAYSTVAQTGYFMLGVIADRASALAEPSLLMFGVAYAAMNIGAFALVLAGGRTIEDIAGFGRARPVAGIALAVFLFSLVGIPPLSGFAGKFLLFGAALESGYTWLAVAAILNSVLSLGVYLRVIHPLFFKPTTHYPEAEKAPGVRFAWGACLAITVLAGLGARGVFQAAS